MKATLGIFGLYILSFTTASISPKGKDFPSVFSPKGECPAIEGEFPVLLPDTEDSNVFYICTHGIPVIKRCPNSMIFDPVLNVCVRKANFLEHTNPPSPKGKCPAVDSWPPVYLPDWRDPSVFYKCSNGVPIKQTCLDGLVFDKIQHVCVRKGFNLFKDLPIAFLPKGQCPSENGEFPVFLPDTEDNTIYYECNHGIPIKMRCPTDLIFDPVLSVCVRKGKM